MKNVSPKVLFLVNAQPSEVQQALMAALAGDAECREVDLNDAGLDHSVLLDQIFAAEKVVCWW